jgi:hypothetical protein
LNVMFGPPFAPSLARGVDHSAFGPFTVSRTPAITSTIRLKSVPPAALYSLVDGVPAIGVGHKPQPVPPVRRPDTASWHNGGPDGISTGLQVSAHSGEPFPSILARNLLSKQDCRTALGDEAVKSGPEVSFVGMATPLSSDRKRLTGT